MNGTIRRREPEPECDWSNRPGAEALASRDMKRRETRQVKLEPEPREDYCDKAGAEALGRAIFAYWKSRGHTVKVWLEFEPVPGGFAWVVKTDLQGGHPSAGAN